LRSLFLFFGISGPAWETFHCAESEVSSQIHVNIYILYTFNEEINLISYQIYCTAHKTADAEEVVEKCHSIVDVDGNASVWFASVERRSVNGHNWIDFQIYFFQLETKKKEKNKL